MGDLLKIRECAGAVLALVTGLSLSVGCERVLGSVEVEPQVSVFPSQADAGLEDITPDEPMPMTGVPACPLGAQRCNGARLESCLSEGEGLPSRWVLLQDCLTEDLCESEPTGRCVTRECDAGEVDCQGAIPVICNAAQTGWVASDSCDSAAHCSTNNADCTEGAPCCLAVPCQAGELRCSANELQRCNSTRTDWELEQACASSDLCFGGLAGCESVGGACECLAAVCAVGETRCNGVALERCNAGQSGWDVVESCATGVLCELGRALSPERCQAPACDVEQFSCTDVGVLQVCRADRTGFDFQENCEGSPFCNVVDGRCEDIPCESGEQRCNGAQIQECRDDRTQFDNRGFACATPELCNDNNPNNIRCQTPACFVNQFDCFGSDQLNRCNDGRTGFQAVGAPCLRPELCSAERRRCDFCFLGRRECTPELDASRTCAANGNFFGPETFCPLGCIPDTGACRTCDFGSYTCQGNTLARCNDGFSFTSLNRNADCNGQQQVRCNNGQVQTSNCGANGCNQARNECNECSGQQRRCAGAGFQQCVGGQFGGTQGCPAGLTCAGQGQCSCQPFSLRCAAGELQACSAQGVAFAPAASCAGAVLRTCQQGVPVQLDCGTAASCGTAVGGTCGVIEIVEDPPAEEVPADE